MINLLVVVKRTIRAIGWNIKIQNYILDKIIADKEIKETREQISASKIIYNELMDGLKENEDYTYSDYTKMVDHIVDK